MFNTTLEKLDKNIEGSLPREIKAIRAFYFHKIEKIKEEDKDGQGQTGLPGWKLS